MWLFHAAETIMQFVPLFTGLWGFVHLPILNKVLGCFLWAITLSLPLSVCLFMGNLFFNRLIDTDETLHSCSIPTEDGHEEVKSQFEIFQGR